MNEASKRLSFPHDDSEIGKIAGILKSPLGEDLFDDMIRYYYVYLIVTVEWETCLPPKHPVSTFFQTFMRVIRSSDVQERLVWCVTEGEKRAFQVDITGCVIMKDVLNLAARKAGFKIDFEVKGCRVVRSLTSLVERASNIFS